MRNFFLLTGPLVTLIVCLVSCSSPDNGLLVVRQYHLQTINPIVSNSAGMARGEQWYRLRGAVTLKERRSRLGHYYSVDWKNDQLGSGDLKVVMDYQQEGTGAKVLQMSRDLPDDEESGKMEFQIAGEAYRVGGDVLSWQVRLMRDGQMIAKKQSYLWK